MGSRDMSPENAAKLLDAELRPYPWYLSVGVGASSEGGPLLFVYTKSGKHPELARLGGAWQGFEIVVKPVGAIRPVASDSRCVAGR
jgi:hypothetical protein